MKWIKVKDRLPENHDEIVLVYAPNCNIIGSVLTGRCFKNEGPSWTVYDFHESKLSELVTHWSPLPSAPNEENTHQP